MNIKVSLTNSEAVNLLTPLIQDKHDNGNFGGRPTVEVEIVLPQRMDKVIPTQVLCSISRHARKDVNGYVNRIGIIKEIRSHFGLSLKDAKDLVECIRGESNL
jgi:hypothetical protein